MKEKIQFNARDIVFAAINGLIFGALLPVTLRNSNIYLDFAKSVTIALFFGVMAAVGVAIGFYLSRIARFFFQLAKFGAVGAANFAVDIGVLNILILFSGTAVGFTYTGFKVISFVAAAINSYAWNKLWTFQKKETENTGKEFAQFMTVSVIGLALNAAVASFFVIFTGPLGGIPEKTWASVAAAIASVAVLAWNFIGYKFWVFKK